MTQEIIKLFCVLLIIISLNSFFLNAINIDCTGANCMCEFEKIFIVESNYASSQCYLMAEQEEEDIHYILDNQQCKTSYSSKEGNNYNWNDLCSPSIDDIEGYYDLKLYIGMPNSISGTGYQVALADNAKLDGTCTIDISKPVFHDEGEIFCESCNAKKLKIDNNDGLGIWSSSVYGGVDFYKDNYFFESNEFIITGGTSGTCCGDDLENDNPDWDKDFCYNCHAGDNQGNTLIDGGYAPRMWYPDSYFANSNKNAFNNLVKITVSHVSSTQNLVISKSYSTLQSFSESCANCDGTGQICINGECSCSNSDEFYCGGECIDGLNDNNNCGSCGNNCGSDQSCVNGECECIDSGKELYLGICIDNSGDMSNCGSIGFVCQTTFYDACCSGKCTDTNDDLDHCGNCGDPCDSDTQYCCGGSCTTIDEENCEDCGDPCDSDTQYCCGGSCTTIDEQNCANCGDVCTNGNKCCGASCTDTDTDNNNCGSCGNSCTSGDKCCGGSCKDIDTDNNNCGSCGHSCDPGESCDDGVCI
jgi:hypothetical protein